MELSDLQIFRAVVEAGGVTGAARRLHRVPSGVTTRIRQLEEELGVELFSRRGNRLELAPAGQLLLPYAERLLSLSSEARAALLDTTPRGRLRLGSMESAAAVRLPGPLAAFHRRYPAVEVALRTGPSGPLLASLLAGDLDAALVADPPADPRLSSAPLFLEELVLVSSQREGAAPLGASTLLAFAEGCTYRRRLTDWLASSHIVPPAVIAIPSYHAMLGCVIAGMGVAALPRSVLATLPGRRRVAARPLPAPWGRVKTSLAWRRGPAGPCVSALLDELRKGLK